MRWTLRRPCPIWGVGAAAEEDASPDNSSVYVWLGLCSGMPPHLVPRRRQGVKIGDLEGDQRRG
jgi:hypothetical protein